MQITHENGNAVTGVQRPPHWGMNRLRRERGWSPRQLAREAGLSHVTVARIEMGLAVPRESTKRQIADALEVSVFELWP